jgi:hypothetical protein
MNLRISSISVSTFLLKTVAFPEVKFYIPVNIWIVEVFPAPLWPNRTKIWSWYMLRERSFTATFPLE